MSRFTYIFAIALMLLAPASARADIAFDSFTAASNGTGDQSFTHTVTGSSVTMLAFILVLSASDVINSVTYGGVALTQQGTSLDVGPGSQRYSKWMLVGPASGANTFAVDLSTSDSIAVSVVTYTGTDGTQPDDINQFNSNSAGTSYISNATSTVSGAWHVAGFRANSDVASANSTKRGESVIGGTDNGVFDSNAAISPIGGSTFNFTNGNSARATQAIVLAPGTQASSAGARSRAPSGGVASGGSLNF